MCRDAIRSYNIHRLFLFFFAIQSVLLFHFSLFFILLVDLYVPLYISKKYSLTCLSLRSSFFPFPTTLLSFLVVSFHVLFLVTLKGNEKLPHFSIIWLVIPPSPFISLYLPASLFCSFNSLFFHFFTLIISTTHSSSLPLPFSTWNEVFFPSLCIWLRILCNLNEGFIFFLSSDFFISADTVEMDIMCFPKCLRLNTVFLRQFLP